LNRKTILKRFAFIIAYYTNFHFHFGFFLTNHFSYSYFHSSKYIYIYTHTHTHSPLQPSSATEKVQPLGMSRGLETIWGISLTPPPPRRFSPRKKCESHRSLHVSLHIPHSQLTRCIMRYNADSCISQIESMYLAWHPPIYPFPKWGLWYEFFFFFVKKKNITCVPSWIQLIFKPLCKKF
jgi:hypothetical protein